MTVEFCLPVYNEEKILKDNVLKLLFFLRQNAADYPWRIVILINNGSSDRSWPIAQELSASYPESIAAVNFFQASRGLALKTYWQNSEAQIAAFMDIDLAVSLENISDLITPLLSGGIDLCVGSRLLPGSKIKRSFVREFSSQSYNFLARIIFGCRFSDLQCGFKAIKTDKFKLIAPRLKGEKWFFDTELIIFANHFRYNIKETPVDWSENRWDKRTSKISLMKDPLIFMFNLIKLKARLAKVRQKM